MAILSICNIEVVYKKVVLALSGVSIDVPRGKIVALLGANGSGKSTTLRACTNLLQVEQGCITRGEIFFDSVNTVHCSPYELVQRGLIQVIEGRRCFSNLSVEENLLSGASSRNRASKSDLTYDLARIYEFFPALKSLRSKKAGFTSGGEQQMIAIGRGLMSRPRLMLLDEPSMGLAPQFMEKLFNMIKYLNTEDKISFLVAEQSSVFALRYAHSACVLENGKVVFNGKCSELAEKTDIVDIYMGGSQRQKDMKKRENLRFRRRDNPLFY